MRHLSRTSRCLRSAVAALSLLLAACGATPTQNDAEAREIKIGALFDLSGVTAEVGKPYALGEQLFLKWKNEQLQRKNTENHSAGYTLTLISSDYAYKLPRAEELYDQFVNREKVVAIAGWGTGDTEALKGKASRDRVPFVSASYAATLADPEHTPYNFLVGTTYSDQLAIAQTWAIDNWKQRRQAGLPKFAYLLSDNPFGKSPIEDGKKHAATNGVAEPLIVFMPRGAPDLTAQLTQIKDSGSNYVFIQSTSAPAALALKKAKELGLLSTTQFVCLNWCADELVVKLSGDAAIDLVGIIPFAPPSTGAPGARLALDYAASTHTDLAGNELHFVQGWWSMAILVEGIERAAAKSHTIDGESIRAALESIDKFDTGGVTAPISFSAQNHAGSRQSRVYRVDGGMWKAITEPLSAE